MDEDTNVCGGGESPRSMPSNLISTTHTPGPPYLVARWRKHLLHCSRWVGCVCVCAALPCPSLPSSYLLDLQQ